MSVNKHSLNRGGKNQQKNCEAPEALSLNVNDYRQILIGVGEPLQVEVGVVSRND